MYSIMIFGEGQDTIQQIHLSTVGKAAKYEDIQTIT